jgi:protein-disulfide isomerase
VEPSLKQLEEALRGQVRVVWKHQPLSIHAQAVPAAQAAEAAREQGKFWQMHEKLFANQTALDGASLSRYAREIGLDTARFERFVSAGKGAARIEEDQKLGNSVGASATPTMFFNCRLVVGAKPFEQFKAIADEEIQKVDRLLAGKRPDAGTYDRACDANVAQGAAFAAAGGGVSVRPDDPVKGSPTAPVTIVLFSDFQCPFCARVNPTLEEAVKAYGNRLKVVWKHMPLPGHQQAIPAAEAAEAAREQGKFWQMHDRLFAAQQRLSEPELFASLAREIGLDMNRYQASIASGRGRARVAEDQAMAARAGIDATPTMLVNGERVAGAVPFADLKATIDRKLSAAR